VENSSAGCIPASSVIFPPCERPFAGAILSEKLISTLLRFHELEQPFAVSAHVAIDFAQCWNSLPFGLTDVKNVDGPESVQRPLTLGCCILTSSSVATSFVFRRPTIERE